MLSTPILVAAAHGGWWGALAAMLATLFTYAHDRPIDVHHGVAVSAVVATGVLRLLYNYPLRVLGAAAAAVCVRFIYDFVTYDPDRPEYGEGSQTSGTSPEDGTFRKLRNFPPRHADPAVAAVLAAEDYYQVRRFPP